jgi:predicted CXXCH cytochrome family protein
VKRLLIGAAVLLLLPTAGFAAVSGTGHDLSANDTDSRTCVFCHYPHNANPAVPLWNHTLSTNTFTAYDSPTMEATDNNDWAGTDGNISGLCMSCHDDSVGLGSLVNTPISGTITDPGTLTAVIPTTTANLSTDLSNDHPVAFTYDATLSTADGELNDPAGLTGDVQLFGSGGDQVECSSCHDPHNSTAAEQPFLVTTNAGSALCNTCHVK